MSRIFISYKREDKEKVFPLKDKIEAATGEKCWIDLDGIESDAFFINVIIKSIEEADVFLFMYSKRHSNIKDYEKDWTIREINYAQKLEKRIVFINIDGTPLTSWFEFLFGFKQQVDASSEVAFNHLLQDLNRWLGRKNPPPPPPSFLVKVCLFLKRNIRHIGFIGGALFALVIFLLIPENNNLVMNMRGVAANCECELIFDENDGKGSFVQYINDTTTVRRTLYLTKHKGNIVDFDMYNSNSIKVSHIEGVLEKDRYIGTITNNSGGAISIDVSKK